MGGIGSGGGRRISEEEKRRRGTYVAGNSDEILDARAVARVVTGPWLEKIPAPTLPLGEVGQKKYADLTGLLWAQRNLTLATQMMAETAASQFEKIYKIKSAGKEPSASDVTQLTRALENLKIAEHAPTLSEPGGKTNRFASCGFSNRRDATVRLRAPRAAGS